MNWYHVDSQVYNENNKFQPLQDSGSERSLNLSVGELNGIENRLHSLMKEGERRKRKGDGGPGTNGGAGDVTVRPGN